MLSRVLHHPMSTGETYHCIWRTKREKPSQRVSGVWEAESITTIVEAVQLAIIQHSMK
jgi:hypothetical protein